MTDSLVAVPVVGLSSGVTAVAAGDLHSCALLASGGVMCWGYGGAGELGDQTTMNSLVPVAVKGLSSGVVAISAGYEDACAVLTDGTLQCWGNNTEGELGNSSVLGSLVPVTVAGVSASVVALGYFYTCVVNSAGGVECWGLGSFGELGNGSTAGGYMPVAAGLAPGATAIAAGNGQTCAVVAGRVQCWGWNGEGELGNGSATEDSLVPVNVVEP
jgi:alpha-tubulin suppressor-like RCC1 family protein